MGREQSMQQWGRGLGRKKESSDSQDELSEAGLPAGDSAPLARMEFIPASLEGSSDGQSGQRQQHWQQEAHSNSWQHAWLDLGIERTPEPKSWGVGKTIF